MTFVRSLFYLCAGLMCLAVGYLAIESAQSVRAIAVSVTAAENDLDTQLAKLNATAADTTKSLTTTASTAVSKLDQRFSSIESTAKAELDQANASIGQVSGAASASLNAVTADVHQAAAPIAATAAQVNDAAELWLDCDHNPDCAFNRYQGVTKATETTLQAIAKAAPEMTDQARKIEGHAERIAGAAEKEAGYLTKPKPWWKHVLDYTNAAAAFAAHLL